jgi:tetratricopeptide (TPR) repeat protein
MIAKIDSIVTARARLAEEAAAAEAARLAAIQAEKDKNYADAIAKADNLFNSKDYANSRNEYRNALSVKPEETYPKERISEIDDLLVALATAKKEQELLDKNYANLIQQADRFFGNKDYLPAKSKYEGALALKPGEEYPTGKIAEIGQILEQQKVDEQYRGIIVAADGFFKTQNYLQAKTEYEKALAIKENEQYPKNQINKIEEILAKEKQRILAEKAAAEDLQRRKQEIAQLNQEIDARNVESEAELNDLYNQFIQKADALFDTKQYNVSRAWYYQALNIKGNEPYPQQRIAEINKLVGSLLLSQRDRDYQKFIDLADSTFRNNDLAVARGWYNRALGIKSNESYPKNQIAEIQKKIAERMAGQAGQKFEEYKQKADKAFEGKNFNVARFWYKKALELRPNDKDVKSKLAEIEK